MTKLLVVILLLLCGILPSIYSYDQGGGQYLAIIGNGDIDDFGWNANVNQGRVNFEATLGISGTQFIPNIVTDQQLFDKVDELVSNGFRVILVTSSYGYTAVDTCARKYPQITFSQYGIKSNLSNLSDIVFSSLDYYFVIGVFCGATTNNGRVGYIFPGVPISNANIANAFYAGVKFANASNEVYLYTTNSFDDPDREQGASDKLINEDKVGALVGQANGLTIPKAAMAAGMLAVGVTGFSLETVFGQQVGISLTHDWTNAFLPFAAGLNGTVVKKDFSGSFRTGAQNVDQKSHFVTADQWAIINASITAMKAANLQYLCGPYMAEFGVLNATGCLNATKLLDSHVANGFIYRGNYSVPLTEIKLPRASMIGLVTTAAFLMVVTCVLMLVVFFARNRESIKLGSYIFLINMLIGSILVFGGVIAWPLHPDKNSCLARIWLPSLGGTIAIAALIVKNLRILIAFHYAKHIKKASTILYLRNYVFIAFALILADLAFLIAYSVVVPSGTTTQQGVDGLSKYQIRVVCASNESSNHAIYALLAYHGFQLLIGCIISYKCRIITDPKYDERKAVAFCLYGVAFCLVVFTVLVGIIGLTNDQLVMGVGLALLLVNSFSVMAIFGAKIMDLYVTEVDFRIPPSPATMKSSSGTLSGVSTRGGSSQEDTNVSSLSL